jgi:cysteine desulfurase/selenocysteine lyase
MSTPVSQSSGLDVESIRADFPILSKVLHEGVPLIYLDNAATTQRPRQVIQAMVETYEQNYANVHRGIHWLSDQSTDLYEEAREKVRTFINASAREEVVFTTGATGAINLVARSWGDANVVAGDEILVTEMEHHSNLVPWHQLAERTEAKVLHVPVTDEGKLDLESFERLLSERTRLVAVTAVSNVLGTINPVEEIVARAHDAGALVLVDGAQSVPHRSIDVQAMKADFVAFSGHKMMGPSGVGVLWGRRELLDEMPPFLGGGSMIRRVKLDGFEPADLPARFEAGTPPIVPAIGLGAAIDYLMSIGLDAIARHEHELTVYAHEVLSGLGTLRFLGPGPDEKSGIVSFLFENNRPHAHDIAQLLDRHGVAVRAGHHCAMPLHKRFKVNATARASFYLYNTREEVDLLAEALAQVQKVFRPRRR